MRALGLALIVVLVWAGGAQARREQSFSYPYSRVWTAALRMLRIDFASPITEKDQEAGYFLFDFPNQGKSYAGSVEVVRLVNNGVETARVVVQVPELPSYVEQMLLDRLSRKLGQDYGAPMEPKPAAPAKKEGESKTSKDGAAAGGSKPEGESKAPSDKPRK